MSISVLERSKLIQDRWIKIHSSQTGAAVLVVCAQKHCVPAPLRHLFFEIRDQDSSDTLPLPIMTNNQRMELPDVATVLWHSGDPAGDVTAFVNRNPADSVRLKRVYDFGRRLADVAPGCRARFAKTVQKNVSDLPDRTLVFTSQIDDHALRFRLGRCFAETARMMSFPRPAVGKGALACATAAVMSASTSARSNTSADSRRMKRVWFPEPRRIFFGSRSLAPWIKQSPTPLAPAAIETMQSEGRSVGP